MLRINHRQPPSCLNRRLQTLCVEMFSMPLEYELASLRSRKFKLRFIRPEYRIPLFSCPILVLPCKFKCFHLILWSQWWFVCCNSAMETCYNQHPAHSGVIFRPALISFVSCWLDFLLSCKLSNFQCLACLVEVHLDLPGLFLYCTQPVSFSHCNVYHTPLSEIFRFSALLLSYFGSSHAVLLKVASLAPFWNCS